jgi:type II secretory pathway component GspD/PulD (secretin)
VVSPPGAAADDLRQVQDSVAEDFRRMGETGAPIPKNWLRALNSDKADVRESATNAIAAYYRSFLRRYRISDESIERITESIIRMMRREDEFASMSEEEAQRHLRQMLVDAGAKFSVSADSVDAPPSGQAGSEEQAIPDKKDDRELRRQEKRRLRLDAKGGRRSQGKGKSSDEEGVDWE